MTLFLLFLCIMTKSCFTINTIDIEPKFEFYDRRKPLIVTCNASGITNNVGMYFSYNENNYTVPPIDVRPGFYTGNFTVINEEQNNVLIVCMDLYKKTMIAAKVYLFGYPPSFAPIDLTCRGFNLMRIECCISPSVAVIKQSLGFFEKNGGEFRMTLSSDDSDTIENPMNKSCYTLTGQSAAPELQMHIDIKNVLGNFRHNFSFNTFTIQKPNKPSVLITGKTSTSFYYSVDVQDFGIYLVNAICTSLSPIKIQKNISEIFVGTKSNNVSFSNWTQHSNLSCIFQAHVSLGKKPIGQPSDPSIEYFQLLEGTPTNSPFVSPFLVYYSSISDEDMLLNVTVYYVNVALVDRAGVIIKYRWMCEDCLYNNHNISNKLQESSETDRYLKLNQARLGSKVFLTACTKINCSHPRTSMEFRLLKNGSSNQILSVISDPKDKYFLKLVWHINDPNNKDENFILACSYKQGRDCSSVEIIELGQNVSGMTNFNIDPSLHWKFAIPSNNISNYMLEWVACSYSTLPIYEAQERLISLNYHQYTKWTINCTLMACDVDVLIKIPSCKEFNSMLFEKLYISYSSGSDLKKSEVSISSSDEIQLRLRDLVPGWNKYQFNISIYSISDHKFLWFTITHRTPFWSFKFICIIVIVLIILIPIAAFILRRMRYTLRQDYFNISPQKNVNDIITKNNPDMTVNLFNTDLQVTVQSFPFPKVVDERYNFRGGELTTLSSSYRYNGYNSSNYDGDKEVPVNVMTSDSVSYVERPNETPTLQYSNIVIGSRKKDHVNQGVAKNIDLSL